MEETNPVDGTSTEIKDPAAVLAALDRAKKDAKQFRVEKEDLETQLKSWQEYSDKIKTKFVQDKVVGHLQGLGLQNSDRLLKYIKMDLLTLNDDLQLEGLDDQIEGLKNDFPELFDPKILVGGKADSGNTTAVDAKLTASQLQAKLVLGR
jgi:hypothetical protein